LIPLSLLVAAGCGGHGLELEPEGPRVTASISAVTLGEDCASAGAPKEPGLADCADESCPFLCQQSNLQLSLAASGDGVARIEVASVRILDENTGAMLDEVESREPQRWSPPRYTAWDERLAAPQSLTVSYKLSAPNWRRIESSARLRARTYRIEVVLIIDGVARTLILDGVSREPEVAT
jgi:hypothetical protein